MTTTRPAPSFSRTAATIMSAKPSESTSPTSTTAPNSSPGSAVPGIDGLAWVIVVGLPRGPSGPPYQTRTRPEPTGGPSAGPTCSESPCTMSARPSPLTSPIASPELPPADGSGRQRTGPRRPLRQYVACPVAPPREGAPSARSGRSSPSTSPARKRMPKFAIAGSGRGITRARSSRRPPAPPNRRCIAPLLGCPSRSPGAPTTSSS